MIHATVCGTLVEDVWYVPSLHEPGKSRAHKASFTISTRKYFENPEHLQLVSCALRGTAAAAHRSNLVAGKRVIVSGDLVLLSGPRLHINVRTLELVGGSYTSDQEPEEDR